MYLLFIKEMLEKGAVGLLLTLDGIIYWLVGGAYRVFMAVAGARLLSSEAYTQVANKIYIIVGVLMLFVLSYAILRAIVDPDKNIKEELGGKMIQRVVVAVVGLAMAPMIFNLLYKAQGLILDNNIIGNLFFNNEVLEGGEDPDQYVDEIGGYVTATSIWEAFFFPSEDSGKTAAEIKTDPSKYFSGGLLAAGGCLGLGVAAFAVPIAGIFLGAAAAFSCISAVNNFSNYAKYKDGGEMTLEEAYVATAAGENFNIYSAFIDNYVDDGEITYLFIISSIAGGFALYSFISFSIDMGVRAAKMAYLQIVAPIPLIMQVIPSGKAMWDSYIKSVKDTFLEVFIRVSVVYVVIYIICHLQKLFSNTSALWGNQHLSPMVKFLALAILILGLITFCKHAPKIIADTLHLDQAGNVKLGMMDKLREGGLLGGAAILGGGLSSAVQGFNKEKFQGNTFKEKLASAMRKTGNGARGLFGGMFQAGKMQMHGNGPKNFREVRSVASRAAAAEGDKIDHAIDRRERYRNAYQKFRNALDEVERAKRERDRAPEDQKEAAKQKVRAAKRAAAEAWKEVNEFTPQGEWLENRKKRIKIWATGTVDLTLENNAIKFGNSFGSLLDAAREQAYVKKDALSKDWKHRYDELEGKKVSEYRSGWDEESYNLEVKKRLDGDEGEDYRKKLETFNGVKAKRDSTYSELQRKQAEVVELEAKFKAGEIPEADLLSAKEAVKKLSEEYANLVSDTDIAQVNLDAAKKAITDKVDAIAKHSAEELTRLNSELQAERDAAKKVYEASSDAFDLVKLLGTDKDGSDAELTELVNGTLRQFQELLQDNPNMVIPLSLKPDGTYDQTTTIYEFVRDLFGKDAADNGSLSLNRDQLKQIFGQAEFVLDTSSTGEQRYLFDAATETYTAPDGTVYNPGQFYTHINALLAADPKGKFDAMTPLARAKDLGKKMRMALENSKSRADKIQRQREADSDKNKGHA